MLKIRTFILSITPFVSGFYTLDVLTRDGDQEILENNKNSGMTWKSSFL